MVRVNYFVSNPSSSVYVVDLKFHTTLYFLHIEQTLSEVEYLLFTFIHRRKYKETTEIVIIIIRQSHSVVYPLHL